jgi:hypothetical protein
MRRGSQRRRGGRPPDEGWYSLFVPERLDAQLVTQRGGFIVKLRVVVSQRRTTATATPSPPPPPHHPPPPPPPPPRASCVASLDPSSSAVFVLLMSARRRPRSLSRASRLACSSAVSGLLDREILRRLRRPISSSVQKCWSARDDEGRLSPPLTFKTTTGCRR